MSIIAGLESTPVHRLRRTWDTLNQRTLATKQALYDLMSPHRNFGAYRDAIRSIGPPCVPFIGVFLTSWTFIGDGNSDTLRDKPDQINMQKRSKAAELIQQIQLYRACHTAGVVTLADDTRRVDAVQSVGRAGNPRTAR